VRQRPAEENNNSNEGANKMRTIETGKNKGKKLADCEASYILWASKHENNFLDSNKWVSRDAKAMLAPVAAPVVVEVRIEQVAASLSIAVEEVAKIAAIAAEYQQEIKPKHADIVWSADRCCYIYAGTGQCVEECDKPAYRIVSTSTKRERFDLVGYVTKKNEDKRNMRAECREIKSRAKSEDIGQRGNLNRKAFSILK